MKDLRLKIGCWLTGDDHIAVKRFGPKSQIKFKLFAVAILIPITMWFFTGFFFMTKIMDKGTFLAILGGLTCSLTILTVEKIILMTPSTLLILTARILLSVSFGVISTAALKTAIYENDINSQYLRTNGQSIRSAITKKYSDEITSLKDRIGSYETTYKDYVNRAKEEARRGYPGPITMFYKAQAEQIKTEYLPPLQAQLKQIIERNIDNEVTSEEKKELSKLGIDDRILLMCTMSFKTVIGTIVFCAFAVIFLALDLIILMLTGIPETEYEITRNIDNDSRISHISSINSKKNSPCNY